MAVGSTEKLYFNFVGGLNTEGSAINNPENTADVLENFVLELNGRLRKRPGLSVTGTKIAPPQTTITTPVTSVHRWLSLIKGVKADFFVIQVADLLTVISLAGNTVTTIGAVSISTYKRATSLSVGSKKISATSGKGYLYVASPEIYPFYMVYDPDTNSITSTKIDLLIRDFYGKDDGLKVAELPSTLSPEHEYNLYNQGWTGDNISEYYTEKSVYPSNAQIWYYGRREIPDKNEPYLAFRPNALEQQAFGNSPAPKGHFILNILDGSIAAKDSALWKWIMEIDSVTLVTIYENTAGYSKVKWRRQQRLASVLVGDKYVIHGTGYEGIVIEVGIEDGENYAIVEAQMAIPAEIVLGETRDAMLYRQTSFAGSGNYSLFPQATVPSIVAFYSGRSWYAGASTRFWSNALFFSQVQDDPKKIGLCYQDADPTSEHISDLIATDGGVVFVDNAIEIMAMMPWASSLVIFASNGVWELSGATDSGFKATNFRISRISDFGAVSPSAILSTGSGFVYWSHSGIYTLNREDISGQLQASSLSQTTVQRLYSALSADQRVYAKSFFDEVNKILYWMYNDSSVLDTDDKRNSFNKVLVLDTRLPAFYNLTFPWAATPITGRMVDILPLSNNNVLSVSHPQVVIGADNVVIGTDTIVITNRNVTSAQQMPSTAGYLVSKLSGIYLHTLTSDTYYDLGSLPYTATVQTRHDLDGEALKKKQMMYIQAHFHRENVLDRVLSTGGICSAPTGWTEVAPMPAARGQTYGAVIGDYFFVFGGSTDFAGNGVSNSVYRYNRLTNVWDSPTTMPYSARELVAQLLPNGRILVAGGVLSTGAYGSAAYWYDPYANTWTQKSNLPLLWIDGRSGVLPDGRVIICGGSKDAGNNRITDTYVYDPALDTYTLTNPLHFATGNHVTATLSDGRIISTAGVGNPASSVYNTHTEIFSPTTMSWTEVSPCPENLGNYSGIVATPCGQVYVWGGSAVGGTAGRKLIYEYIPATDKWIKLSDLPFFAGYGAYGQFANGQYIWASGHDGTAMTAKTYISVAPTQS